MAKWNKKSVNHKNYLPNPYSINKKIGSPSFFKPECLFMLFFSAWLLVCKKIQLA